MKKFFMACAALAMGMTLFTACVDDEQEALKPTITTTLTNEDLTIVEGQSLTIAPTYDNTDPWTVYEWTVNGAVVSKDPQLTYTFPEAGTYTVRVKTRSFVGTTVKEFLVTVKENLKTVTFEEDAWSALIDSQQYNGTLLYGDNAVNYAWADAVTGLGSKLTLAWGGSWGFAEGGIAISNYIDADIQNHATYEYQLAVPASNGSKNFAVVYCDASMSFADNAKHVIKSMDIIPTTYVLGVMTNGDGYAASLKESGNFTITLTADNGKTLDVDLARDGNIMTTWTTVDLSSLGEVNSLSFTMDGSDKSDYGVKHPKYFAFDNVVVKF